MSTHIDNAWLIPTNKLSALVAIAQKVTEIHRSTIVAEVIDRMRDYFWLEDSIEAVKKLPKYNVLRFFGKVRKTVKAHEHKATYDMPKEVRTELEKGISAIFETRISDQDKTHLILVAEDLFETVQQYSGAALSFLVGEGSSTYMVGHALSTHAIKWCNKHFRDFHYQNSTDEPLEGFDPSFAKALDKTFADADCPLDDGQKEYVKNVLSAHIQDKRGKVWGKAFGRSTNYAKAGLSYRCLSWDFDSEDIALLAARKLFGLKNLS